MRYTAEQVGAWWILGGGPREATAEAISQAYVESGFDPNAVSSAGYVGLWQDGQDPSLKDPLKNARAAVVKYRDGGNSFVKHWTNFQAAGTEAKRLAYLPRATIAARKVQDKPVPQLTRIIGSRNASFLDKIPNPVDPLINPLDLLPDGAPDIPNPLDGLGALFEPISNIAEILKGFMQTWFEIVKKIADPNTWKDAGKILLGLIMLTIGLRRVFTVVT